MSAERLSPRVFKASMKERSVSLVAAPFPQALMKVLHVMLVILAIDMAKVDYQRNYIYMYFVWMFFALISVARTMNDKSAASARAAARAAAAPE